MWLVLLCAVGVSCGSDTDRGPDSNSSRFDENTLDDVLRSASELDRFTEFLDLREIALGEKKLGSYVPAVVEDDAVQRYAAYLLWADAATRLSVDVAPTDQSDAVVLLYRLGATRLAKADSSLGGGAESIEDVELPETGIYIIIVAEFDMKPGSFTVELSSACEPVSECTLEDGSTLCGKLDDGCGGLLDCGPCQNDLRLTDPGLLQLFHNNEWRGVCDDGFGQEDADVACRQLGGTVVQFLGGQTSEAGFWLDDLACTGNEASLAACPHPGFGQNNCGNGEHVRLQCAIEPDTRFPGPYPGDLRVNGPTRRLEILHGDEWRGVCSDGFEQADAEVACRQLGQSLVDFSPTIGPSPDFWLSQIACTGSETRLEHCVHGGWGVENCNQSQTVSLNCQ